jgi:hypothetical protein
MGAGALDLARLVRDELTRPAPPGARLLADAIRARLGPATASVVFYGSCLRRGTSEGVLDFYAAVDGYRAALGSRAAAWAAAALPPAVFYLECETPTGALRCKYAVLSQRDFARAAAPGGWRTGVWARFCQPTLAVWTRDERALEALVDVGVTAILTAVRSFAAFAGDAVAAESFWHTVFHETYAAEMRTERTESIRSLQAAAPERYAHALRAALAELEDRGELRASWTDGVGRLELPAAARRRGRRAWRLRRPIAKVVYLAQLLKTAFTFGDWLPYALWKLERHTGARFAYSERQRRHPFVFGWPLLFRALRQRHLR